MVSVEVGMRLVNDYQLINGLLVDAFVRDLLSFPAETEILSEAVYANSQTLDGRRFAEEFIRRRKLADKGQIPDPSSGSGGLMSFSPVNGGEGKNGGGGGWSEVAKKQGPSATTAAGSLKEEASSSFKVVAAKKKGKR